MKIILGKFCAKCFSEYNAKFIAKYGNDPTISLNMDSLIFPCRTPIKYYDHHGVEKMCIWNHDTKQYDHYTQKEFEEKFEY